MFLYPTQFVPSAVQFVSVPLAGVPSVGAENTGDVIVCTPVNVFAASVLAIVADVEGNVIVVQSVPARVREFDTDSFFHIETIVHSYCLAQLLLVVQVVSLQYTIANVPVSNVRKIVHQLLCTVTNPVDEFLIKNHCPRVIVDATGITTVCVVLPVKS
jgi:hypothetical protein